ncbi:hypothetical protein HDU91_005809 [Kappamyces sp. JEL0680]|nr:hypothetical protein HDU91_005809 [Kappamyces sp. JEL0680]
MLPLAAVRPMLRTVLAPKAGIASSFNFDTYKLDSYLAKAHLQELRNELSGLRQNDSQNLKEEAQSILREIEFLDARFSDSLLQLKSDISMDLNLHKAESKELTTEVDLRIQEIHHKLSIRLSELKTNIETMKVDLTTSIFYVVFFSIASLIGLDWVLKLERAPVFGQTQVDDEKGSPADT